MGEPRGMARGEKGGAMEQPRKRLYRSRTNRTVAGVCGGLAEYFNIDVTFVRLLFIVLALFGGSGLVLYGLMWLFVPEERKVPPTGSSAVGAS